MRGEIVRIVDTDRQTNKRRLKIIVGSNDNVSIPNFLFLDVEKKI